MAGNKHLKNIFESGEFLEDIVISILEIIHVKKSLFNQLDGLNKKSLWSMYNE